MMKKILAIALAIVMLFAVVACNKNGADDGNDDAVADKVIQNDTYTDANTGDVLSYAVNDRGSYEITGFVSNDHTPHKVEIPAQINGVEVTGIADHAFKVNNQIKEIVLPESILYIGDWAFFGCGALTAITIPNSVEELGVGSFDDCTALTSVKLSDKLSKITEFAFRGCTALESVELPLSVKEIGDGAFFRCEALTEIVIPGAVEVIGDGAFMKCTNLAQANVSFSVKTIGVRAFDGAAEGFAIAAAPGSVAATYAADNGYGFVPVS